MAKRKQKSRLAKIMTSNESTIYETTEQDCQHWFEILNEEIFENKLLPLDEIDIRWRRGTFAFYECVTDTKNASFLRTRLCMNKRYKSKQFFVSILAHELIHHYQALYNEPLGHGPSFFRWSEKLNKKGIKLTKAYDK